MLLLLIKAADVLPNTRAILRGLFSPRDAKIYGETLHSSGLATPLD